MSGSTEPQRKQRRLRLGAVSRMSNGEEAPTRARLTRREELLEIAAELFAARGFANVTVDDLGSAAGVSGPALYHHFDSKEAMLGEMLVDISHYLFAESRVLRESTSANRLLEALIEMHVDFAVDHRALISVRFRDLLLASADDQRRVRILQRQYVEIWVDALLVRNPELPTPVARSAIHAVLGLINSTPFSQRARRADLVPLLRSMAIAGFTAVTAHTGEVAG